jgi:hypothetical protein
MRHINGAYTAYFNAKWSRSGHLFQGRYKAILVEMDEYAKELSRYIHLNPVRANMVKSPETYPWSSYINYIGREKAPQWLHRDFILGYFGNKTTLAQQRYQQFVLSLVDQAYDSPLREATGSVLLGTQDFIESIQSGHLFAESPNRDLPAIRQLLPCISIERVVETVEEIFEKDRSLARNVSLYLCRKHTGEKLKTIGERFGISDSAVSQVCKRLPTRIENDVTLKDKLERAEKKLKMSNVET